MEGYKGGRPPVPDKFLSDFLISHVDAAQYLPKFTAKHMTNQGRLKLARDTVGPYLDRRYQKRVGDRCDFKSAEDSVQHREQGNKAYQGGDAEKGNELYTQSIACAPPGSLELALAFANRSASLRSLGRLRECVEDVQRALEGGYPELLRHKLLLREAQCWRDLGEVSKAREAFSRAVRHVEECALLPDDKKAEITQQLEREKKAARVRHPEKVEVIRGKVPALSHGPSEKVPTASAAIEVRRDDTLGRHLVAKQDIDVGTFGPLCLFITVIP